MANVSNELLMKVASFIADALHNDIAEGGENQLVLTNIHLSDFAPNCISIETMAGDRMVIMVNSGWVS